MPQSFRKAVVEIVASSAPGMRLRIVHTLTAEGLTLARYDAHPLPQTQDARVVMEVSGDSSVEALTAQLEKIAGVVRIVAIRPDWERTMVMRIAGPLTTGASTSPIWIGLAIIATAGAAGWWTLTPAAARSGEDGTPRTKLARELFPSIGTRLAPRVAPAEPKAAALAPKPEPVAPPPPPPQPTHVQAARKFEAPKQREAPKPALLAAAPELQIAAAPAPTAPAPGFRPQIALPAPAPPRPADPAPAIAPVRPAAPAQVTVTPPVIAKRAQPIFPENVRRMFMGEKRVTMSVSVDEAGLVTASSCANCGDRTDAILAGLASAALKNWKFQPAMLGKQPVVGSTTVEFRFTTTRR